MTSEVSSLFACSYIVGVDIFNFMLNAQLTFGKYTLIRLNVWDSPIFVFLIQFTFLFFGFIVVDIFFPILSPFNLFLVPVIF